MGNPWPFVIAVAVLSLLSPHPSLVFTVYALACFLIVVHKGAEDAFRGLLVRYDLRRGTGFAGEELSVKISLQNRSRFPVFWYIMSHLFPAQLGAEADKVVGCLPAKGRVEHVIRFRGRGRGIYKLPATAIVCGDAWGLYNKSFSGQCPEDIVIYPPVRKIVGLTLERRLPQGRQRVLCGLYEDPSRMRGCRGYRPSDHLKRLHWPNIARTGSLQVKEWETTLHADTALFLNLREEDYPVRSWSLLLESGVELAASLCCLLLSRGDDLGFYSNGAAAEDKKSAPFCLPPKRGENQGRQILTYLAGADLGKDADNAFFWKEAARLAAGSSLVFITPGITPGMAAGLGGLRRSGRRPAVLWLAGGDGELCAGDLKRFRIPWYAVEKRRDDNVFCCFRKG
ncbi:MAG: DUF58 domain-containing protein [Bacillota bacterium]